MTNKNKNKSKSKGKDVIACLLTPAQRSILANRIRVQLLSIESPGKRLEEMDSIKRLNLMLTLFEQHGREFDTLLPLPLMQDKYLEVRLRVDRNRPSVVVIRHGKMPETVETHAASGWSHSINFFKDGPPTSGSNTSTTTMQEPVEPVKFTTDTFIDTVKDGNTSNDDNL